MRANISEDMSYFALPYLYFIIWSSLFFFFFSFFSQSYKVTEEI